MIFKIPSYISCSMIPQFYDYSRDKFLVTSVTPPNLITVFRKISTSPFQMFLQENRAVALQLPETL